MSGINNFEYTRGLITASILWGGFVIFLAIYDIIKDMLEWAFGRGLVSSSIFILFIVVTAILIIEIGNLSFIKLTRNRLKYFSTEKIKKILNNEEDKLK